MSKQPCNHSGGSCNSSNCTSHSSTHTPSTVFANSNHATTPSTYSLEERNLHTLLMGSNNSSTANDHLSPPPLKRSKVVHFDNAKPGKDDDDVIITEARHNTVVENPYANNKNGLPPLDGAGIFPSVDESNNSPYP